jgi:hypothetical protein
MAAPVTVAVRRQVVEAEVRGTERDGLQVQRHLSGTVDEVVARALERALAGVVPEDDHLVIDRIDIEVGEVPYAALDEALADAVRSDVEAFVRQHPPPPTGHPGGSADVPGASETSGPVVRRSTAATVDEAFVVFVRDGRLPWAFRPTLEELEASVADAWASADTATGGPDGLRRALEDPVARLRVVKQFSAPFVQDLVRRVEPGVAGPLAEASLPGGSTRSQGPVWWAFARQVQLAALGAVAERRTVTAEELVRRAVAGLPEQSRADPDLVEHLRRRWPRVSCDVPAAAVDPPRPAGAAGGRRDAGADRDRTPPEATAAVPSLLVDHAGMVLLHPFLPRFLEGLGVAAGDELLDADRAVGLLHHLATGQRLVPEQMTPLAKVLCGRPLNEPVERDPHLTTDEIAEATALLTAVIGHWEALRTTSPDALRAEFLTRPGTLSTDGGDSVLRVEDRSVDILLAQLPWGISMVQTPWMQRMLRVEWRA